MKLTIPLDDNGPLGRQIFEGLREAILSGRLRAGDRLPSTRDLAEQWGVSRTIVVIAFEQLLAEGYVGSRRGSGTYVLPGIAARIVDRREETIALSAYGRRAQAASAAIVPAAVARPRRYDFAYGRGDVTDFPFAQWRQLLAKHARKMSVRDLDYGVPAGNLALREAICDHVARSRGVACDPSQIVVVSGSQQAIDLIVRVLVDAGDTVAIEDPHYQGTRAVLAMSGARLHAVDVDDAGLDPEHLPSSARALFLTPSHQFPTGTVLTIPRRLAILDWARRSNAVVVEDDYDGEFRYDGQPLQSLQGLDTAGRVIYVGTFSRTIFAALRVGYLIVPKSLVDAFATAKWLADRHTAGLEQRVLAEFIGSGAYERYLRRVRRSLSLRRDALVDAVEDAFGGTMRMTGAASGAHVVLWPAGDFDEERAIDTAAANDVGVYPLSGYFVGPGKPGLLLGYSQMSAADIREGIRRLAGALHARR
ncbi:PLP-dependent aminotransferase family protein [Luteibacter yeojuensis]|uniref:PLP-dependent aminotransferase family protein n=1 Tax=Luteibacter yeojuensis TaxID=345309 RepID=A0A7X5QRK0_9GAMM|nr:PLP-dependent aminotransferase family protein [Luteibacter yeojuensis]NID14070.1 PLP-dependent aminotransferase family protein [Luteibacter yeojuensis]